MKKKYNKERMVRKEIGTHITNKYKISENKIILILFLIIFFLVVLRTINQSSLDVNLQKDAEKILNAITTNNLKILDSNQVDEKSLEEMMEKDYTKLKRELGLKNDFCIYFEDENGKLLRINGVDTGIGSPKVKINGVSCG